MQIPESWPSEYKLPDRIESDIEEIYNDLMCDLFHMPDEEANKIKYQYLLKYPFLDKDKISKW
jgi:hypothetical protein